jgi:hypothetical protein
MLDGKMFTSALSSFFYAISAKKMADGKGGRAS